MLGTVLGIGDKAANEADVVTASWKSQCEGANLPVKFQCTPYHARQSLCEYLRNE